VKRLRPSLSRYRRIRSARPQFQAKAGTPGVLRQALTLPRSWVQLIAESLGHDHREASNHHHQGPARRRNGRLTYSLTNRITMCLCFTTIVRTHGSDSNSAALGGG
jgi:hypothetical protein